MAEIIQLLPDAIANQIAAGEVVQRPASVVKELLENSIDAGATYIQVIVKDGGKTLIQVIDNGCGMSPADARMSFERHATSKIREAADLFAIRTMGFRGEALASIGAVAQVEMKTRLYKDEIGTAIKVEGSKVIAQEPCSSPPGTSFSVKNLFYNVPARRQFLKSDTIEMRRLIEEFQRVAIANPDVGFSFFNNNTELYHLQSTNLRQRIVGLFGSTSNKKLVPVQESTDVIQVHGFVGSPAHAKKRRGEQYFFVNNRYIKSNYLNHAVISAYENLIPKENYPLYVIFIDIDPSRIDINVHPTKQEIKFDDERLVYHYLKVAVRHALGQYSMMPTIDFDLNPIISNSGHAQGGSRHAADADWKITTNDTFRPDQQLPEEEKVRNSHNLSNWKSLYEGLDADLPTQEVEQASLTIASSWDDSDNEADSKPPAEAKETSRLFQMHHTYIVSQIKSGFLVIDQQAAHERILFERYLKRMQSKEVSTQQKLFPKSITLTPADATLLQELLPAINSLGFDVQEFGQDSFVIHGIPTELVGLQNEEMIVEQLLEQLKLNLELKIDKTENIARSLAKSAAVKRKQKLEQEEMQELVDQLFACESPYKSPSGRNCFIAFELDELEKRFKQ